MRKARFKETEVVRVLKEIEGGRQVKEMCREYGLSDSSHLQKFLMEFKLRVFGFEQSR